MERPKQLILILGGARAGKSAFAQWLAAGLGGSVAFLATAQPGDEEMRRRIEEHRRLRPPAWQTVEAPLRPSAALPALASREVVLLDCVTLLVSNLLLQAEAASAAEAAVEAEIGALLEAFEAGPSTLIIVSNEVGLSVVPPTELGRIYRDLLGRANQRLAQAADEVFWVVAGLPVEIKASRLAIPWESARVSG